MKEEELEYGKTLVTKTGGFTGTTTRILNDNIIQFDMSEDVGTSIFYVFKNCYEILDDKHQFFEIGDSGSGVFLCQENGRTNKALGIGMAIGTNESKNSTFVCNIKEIVKTFNIDIPQKQD